MKRLSSLKLIPLPHADVAGRFTSLVNFTNIALALGIFIRLGQYLYNHTIWYDESVLLFNILDKSYAGLVGKLDYAVAAPPLFVWLLKTLSIIFGDSAYAFRAVPFVFSCATLMATVPLAKAWLPKTWLPWAVAMVAFSEQHIWLGTTIKPYAGDAFFTTMLLLGFTKTTTWSTGKRLYLLAAVSPICLCFSYPSAFVLGALMVAALPQLRTSFVPYATAAFTMVFTFGLLYFGPVKDQRVNGLVEEWARDFVPWANPIMIPLWLIQHTVTIFQFAMMPSGLILGVLAPLAIKPLVKDRGRGAMLVVVLPFVFAILAAGVKAYPFGYNRLMLFVAPCCLVLATYAFQGLQQWFSLRAARTLAIVVLAVMCIPTVVHCVKPYGRPDSSAVKNHVQRHRLPGDRVASNEAGYVYFFRGELLSLNEAQALPPGTRLWTAMDHYTPERRRQHNEAFLVPHGYKLVTETVYRDASVWLWVKE